MFTAQNMSIEALIAICIGVICVFEVRSLRLSKIREYRARGHDLEIANRRLAVDARFVEMSKDLAITLDFGRNIVACNGAWEEILGWTLEELREVPLRNRFHPDDVGRVLEGVERLAIGGTIDGVPVRAQAKNGDWHWLEWSAVGSPDERLIYASARDVTARVRLETELEIERQQLRSAQELARIGSWHVEIETGEMFWSDATYDLLAIARPESPPDATLWLASMDPQEHERAQYRLAEAIREGGEFSFEFRRSQPDVDGQPVYLATKGVAEQGANGRVTRLIGTIVDITERKRYEEGLRFIADHDPLTSLPNRRRFDDVLVRHIAECERYGPRGAALLLDLDKLKLVNDELGHVAGDEMIKCVADTLRERLRSTDLGARIGGDEFAVLLSETTRDGANLVAHSIAERLAESSPALRSAGISAVTASIGFVLIEDLDQISPEAVLAAADDAMYAAKRTGPGQIREHDSRALKIVGQAAA
jgi:diguanylate cyclase (GGDEF)-like protein/PAS domain S-box-containing protein